MPSHRLQDNRSCTDVSGGLPSFESAHERVNKICWSGVANICVSRGFLVDRHAVAQAGDEGFEQSSGDLGGKPSSYQLPQSPRSPSPGSALRDSPGRRYSTAAFVSTMQPTNRSPRVDGGGTAARLVFRQCNCAEAPRCCSRAHPSRREFRRP